MSAFIVVRVKAILDPARYNDYRRQVPPLLARYGARYIVKGCDENLIEGNGAERFTIIEFPSMDLIYQFWNSDEYLRIKQIRQGAVDVKVGFLDGLTGTPTPAP